MKDHYIKQSPIQGLEGSGGGLASRLAGAGGADLKYVDDVFSTFLFDGTRSTLQITNGIDLAGEGGMVWSQVRDSTNNYGTIYDTENGTGPAGGRFFNAPQGNNGTGTQSDGLTSFNSDGYTLGGNLFENSNDVTYGQEHVSWTFRKAPGFFDVVTYTGNGVGGREIPHSLGSTPGMVIVKRTNGADNWTVQHRSLGGTKSLYLNRTDSEDTSSTEWNNTAAASNVFTVGTSGKTNALNDTYVAYIFAHDDQSFGQYADQSAIKCGSYTGTGNSSGPTIDLGFEPQWLLIKPSSGSGNWQTYDTMRGWSAKGVDATLYPNLNAAEDTSNQNLFRVTSRGFQVTANFTGNDLNVNYIYVAIRRPNKPPTAGSQVFDVKDVSMSGSAEKVTTSLQTVDATWNKIRTANGDWMNTDRLHNGYWTRFNQTNATQYSPSGVEYDYSYAVEPFYWVANEDHSPYMFKRRPGFFDVVSYIGDGTTSRLVPHNLEAPPELIIIKRTSTTGDWWVYPNKPGYMMYMNRNNAEASYTAFGTHTSTAFQTETVANNDTNTNGAEYVAYLFATLPGVSKVGTYTGQSTDFDVDCGFTTGARFIMVKRTDTAADWYVMDTVNGLGAGTDMYVLPNSDAQQSSQDLIDSILPSGFKVNTSGGMPLGINGATYFFLAIS